MAQRNYFGCTDHGRKMIRDEVRDLLKRFDDGELETILSAAGLVPSVMYTGKIEQFLIVLGIYDSEDVPE